MNTCMPSKFTLVKVHLQVNPIKTLHDLQTNINEVRETLIQKITS